MADTAKKVLNPQQKKAVEHPQGPLLIIAGAGTGKTTVVTERVKLLIASKKAKPSEILALTFTNKAAREMEERIDIALPYGYTDMWISTFHSFCDRILRQEAIQIGLDPGYKLMTQSETIQFLTKNLFKFDLKYFRPLGNPTKFVDGMIQHFSRLKDEDATPEDYLKFARQQKKTAKSAEEKEMAAKTMELAKAYRVYEELKVKQGLMDFGDLISNTLKLFRTRKTVLRQYQKQFKYILVDEFQDTNYAQYALLKVLSPPSKKPELTVVGDDSQCLPADTKISTSEGEKRISRIRPGEQVLTAVGKGHTSLSHVKRVFKRKTKVRFLTFILKDGKKVTVTDNHKMFCYTPTRMKDKNHHFVYIMHQRNLGWRVGITNDLATRLRIERHADKIIGIGSYRSNEEARFYEAYYSAKFGLPTVPFTPRQRQAINGPWLERLFSEINTQKASEKLAEELHLELDSPHFVIDGVYRGVTDRVKVHLQMCYRNYRSKTHKDGFVGNPQVAHKVWVETSSKRAIKKLKEAGISLSSTKKGKCFRFSTIELRKAGQMAEKLVTITDGVLDKKFAVGTANYQHKFARIVPASHILIGNYLPVLKGKSVVYKKVVDRKEEGKLLTVYDLEVDRTHNFVANGVVVHNSIYKFRGAAVSNILQFMEEYKRATQVVLANNYRSTQTILDQAYQLIKNNDPDTLEVKLGISKDLRAVRKVKEMPIEFIYRQRVEDEAEVVAKKILALKKESPDYDWKDFAILVRANNHADAFTRALSRHGIPYQFLGPGQLFRQAEVKDLIAYLKVLYNFEDNVALYRVLSMDHFDISARDLAAINNYGRWNNLSLFEACEIVDKIFVSSKTKEKIKKFVEMVHRHLKLLPKETAGQIIYYFLEDGGLLQKLTEYKSPLEEKQAQNISKFFDRLKTYEVDHEDASVQAVVDWIMLSMELGESPLASDIDWTEEDRVNLLTVHSAKGLEFPIVFLVNLVAARFPTRERKEQIPIPEALIKEILPAGDYHEQEERRLFYVGMTRAMDRLFFTAANYYGEGKREKKLSPFAYEALGKEMVDDKKYSAIRRMDDQLSIFDLSPSEKPTVTPPTITPITYLSYSQIDIFNTCPLQYRYRYIQRIPVPPSAALSFGDSVHKALRDFGQTVKRGEKPTEKDLFDFLDQRWSSQGYVGKAHEQRMKKEGRRMLKDFYSKFDGKKIPLTVEQPFVIKLTPALKVGGKIDQVNKAPEGLEIIDYKTGRVLDQKDVDKSLQMTVYALAAIDKGIYAVKPEKVTLTFYFLDTGEKKSTKRTREQLEKAKEELIKKADSIKKSDFSPKPGPWCDFCEYRLICEAWQ